MTIPNIEQRIELIAQELEALKAEVESGGGGGGEPVDAYTKAQSDEKFLSKADAVSNYQPKGSYATSSDITTAIEALDVETTPVSGSYVKSISEVDGKIVPVAEAIDTTPTENSTHPITSGAVYSAIQNIPGGGGTSDYTDLTNKPSINSVTLSGNKSAADLNLVEGHSEYFVVNSIRVYVSASEPTGTIPAGSIWIGG